VQVVEVEDGQSHTLKEIGPCERRSAARPQVGG
jgi:hypothetical protein